jgi:hypothetical protein
MDDETGGVSLQSPLFDLELDTSGRGRKVFADNCLGNQDISACASVVDLCLPENDFEAQVSHHLRFSDLEPPYVRGHCDTCALGLNNGFVPCSCLRTFWR